MLIPRQRAIERMKEMGIPDPKTTYSKFVTLGGELREQKIGSRFYIESSDLENWKRSYDYRCLDLSEDDYRQALNFAVVGFYEGGFSSVEWGQTKRRDVGEFLSNQTMGKLGEIAFKRFLADKFNLDISIDFNYKGEIGGQDIFGVRILGKNEEYRQASVKVSIKTTKATNFNLWVVKDELESNHSRSEYYVLTRVNLPIDHLLRYLKDSPKLSSVQQRIPDFEDIRAEIAGYTTRQELMAKGVAENMIGATGKVVQKLRTPQYVMLSGDLKRTPADFKDLAEALSSVRVGTSSPLD
jgi:hypothetical protein